MICSPRTSPTRSTSARIALGAVASRTQELHGLRTNGFDDGGEIRLGNLRRARPGERKLIGDVDVDFEG